MNRMKSLREERGMPMKEVARRLGIPYTTYVNYEKGTREPNSEMLIHLANFYNCSVDYLIGKTSERIDDTTLDTASEISDWLLELVGNLAEAQEIQLLLDAGQLERAKVRLSQILNQDAGYLLDEGQTYVGDSDYHMNQLFQHAARLNAQGLERLVNYAEDLTGNPTYQKKTPSSGR